LFRFDIQYGGEGTMQFLIGCDLNKKIHQKPGKYYYCILANQKPELPEAVMLFCPIKMK
jgi:hypothetical protein